MTKETTNNINHTETKPVQLKLPLMRIDGSSTGTDIELDSDIFDVPRNDHVLYLSVKAEMTNRRQGTRATLTRAMVRGGGRKPWRQKGRGAARAGTIRSPIWKGGGVIFGPQPQVFSMKVPRKVRRLARRIAFSVKARDGVINIIEDFNLEQPKTKPIANMLAAFDASGKSALILVEGHKPTVVKSSRNIPRLEVREGLTASTTDILRARNLFICRSALDSLRGGFINEK